MASNMNENQFNQLLSMLGYGAGAAGIGGGLYNLFSKPADISGAANQYLNQIPGAMQPYYQPYMQAGQQALGQLQNQFGQLTNQTGDVYNRLAGGYKESPGYKRALSEALGAAGGAAAAGGMLGTGQSQLQAQDVAESMSNRDFGDYMGRMMGLYNTGLSGLSGINQQGFDASTSYGNMMGNILGQQAQYAAMQKAMQAQKRGQGMGQLFGGLGALAGGPLGGFFGSLIGKGFGG